MNNNRAGGDGGGIANGLPLGGQMPLIGGPVTLNHSLVIGKHGRPGRRHIQLRRNGDAVVQRLSWSTTPTTASLSAPSPAASGS